MDVLYIVAPIFGVIGVGWVARAVGLVKERALVSFNNFVFYIALPFLIFRGVSALDLHYLTNVKLLSVNVLGMVILGALVALVGGLFLGRKKHVVAMFVVAAYFGNVAYIGIPFNELAFGSEGAAIATLISVVVVIFAVFFGLGSLKFLAGDKKAGIIDVLVQILKIPMIWAALLGILVVLSGTELWEPLDQFVDLFARLAGPLALFSLGMFVHETKFNHELGLTTMLALFNLLALPLVVYLVGVFLGFEGLAFKVSIIQAGMPIAVTNFIFSSTFKLEEKLICQSIVFSVVLAPLTLSLLLLLVKGI